MEGEEDSNEEDVTFGAEEGFAGMGGLTLSDGGPNSHEQHYVAARQTSLHKRTVHNERKSSVGTHSPHSSHLTRKHHLHSSWNVSDGGPKSNSKNVVQSKINSKPSKKPPTRNAWHSTICSLKTVTNKEPKMIAICLRNSCRCLGVFRRIGSGMCGLIKVRSCYGLGRCI